MIWKILKLYVILVFVILTFTKDNIEIDNDLESKILKNEIIKIKDIVLYLKSNKEIKSIKFFILFILTYPFTFLLIISSLITLIWSIYYYININFYKKNKNYIPICIDQKFYKIHSQITIYKIIKMLFIQIPKIKGFNNAYTISNRKQIKNKKKEIIVNILHNYKNIIVFSISPLRLHFIIELTLFSHRNIKQKFYLYELRKYIYNQIYVYNYTTIEKTKKMRILKKENGNIVYNPPKGKRGTDSILKESAKMFRVQSQNGPHPGILPFRYDEKDLLIAQLTGKIPLEWLDVCQSIRIKAENYKYDSMYIMTNISIENTEMREYYSSKVFESSGILDPDRFNALNLLVINKRYFNRSYIINPKKNTIVDLEGRNTYEKKLTNSYNNVEIKKAEGVLNAYEKMSHRQWIYLQYQYQSTHTYDFHNKENSKELLEMASNREIRALIDLEYKNI